MSTAISEIPEAKLEAIAHGRISQDLGFYLGPYVIGMLIDAVLFGVVVQMYIKWHTYSMREDRKLVRGLVWYLMLLAVVSTTFLAAWIFHLFVYGFGTYARFFRLDWTTWWFVINMAGRLPVAVFFAHRAWEMTKRNLTFAILVASLLLTVLATTIPIKVLYRKDADLTAHLVIAHMGCEALADIVITLTIAIYLMRSKTGWTSTDKLISRLLFLVVESQLPPTILTIIFLGLFVRLSTRPLTNFYACAPKVYTVCLLVILNSRQTLRRDLSNQQEYPLSHLSKEAQDLAGHHVPTMPRQSTHIHVTTETVTQVHRNTLVRPKFSVNRDPHPNLDVDLEVEQDGDTDKDTLDGRLNSSEVRLTGSGEKGKEGI